MLPHRRGRAKGGSRDVYPSRARQLRPGQVRGGAGTLPGGDGRDADPSRLQGLLRRRRAGHRQGNRGEQLVPGGAGPAGPLQPGRRHRPPAGRGRAPGGLGSTLGIHRGQYPTTRDRLRESGLRLLGEGVADGLLEGHTLSRLPRCLEGALPERTPSVGGGALVQGPVGRRQRRLYRRPQLIRSAP